MNLAPEQWETVLADAASPTYGEILTVLKENEYVDTDERSLLDDALETGTLVEDDGAMFGAIRVADEDEKPAEGDDTPTTDTDEITREDALNAFEDAIEFFHAQLDREISFPDANVDTPRDYYREVRGWTDETIDEKRLGWAPASRGALLHYLMGKGHDGDAIMGTGLFYKGFTPHFKGRLVFPYFKEDRPVYAISRSVGLDADPKSEQKYTKAVKTKEYSHVDEVIYGLDSVEESEDLLITEGMADAITAHEAGYATLSPVTTQFKHDDRERLLNVLEERDVGRVFVVQDAERPSTDITEDRNGWDTLTIEQYGEGLKGAVDTAGFLRDRGVDAQLAELPRLGLDKVDLDDYLHEWSDTLAPILASARPANHHPAYTTKDSTLDPAERDRESVTNLSGEDTSAIFDLDITDVAGVSEGYRGTNPLGHHGESEHYFIITDDGETAFDHKYKAGYTALTFLLTEEGSRPADRPEGPLSDEEVLTAWVHAKQKGYIADDDPAPRDALKHVALANDLCEPGDIEDDWKLPTPAYNDAIDIIDDEYGVDAGRGKAGNRVTDDTDPTSLDVTLNPKTAWDAADLVTPDDLDDAAVPLDLEETADGAAWMAPNGLRVNVVRAAALSEGYIPNAKADLDHTTYDLAYRKARSKFGAPLPEYLNQEAATDQFHLIKGALNQLNFHHLDRDALRSDVTAEGDEVGGDAILALNPAWRDSDSGESVVVYPSGVVYDFDTACSIRPIKFVALEIGLLKAPSATLRGEAFRDAYNATRTDYSAPLPRWEIGDVDATVVLPEADDVLDDLLTDEDRLKQAQHNNESLYTDLATDYAHADEGKAHLLQSLPALGKTTAAVKRSEEIPTLYATRRKELMKEVEEKAKNWGVSYCHLPVFAENPPEENAVNTAVRKVQEEGMDILRDPDSLLESLREDGIALREDEDEDNDIDPLATIDHPDEDEEIHLDRASCSTADGAGGDELWLAVHTARQLGYSPRQIHQQATVLFGQELPCEHTEDGEERDCTYKKGWDDVNDPGRPADLHIGHYTHAHVKGAVSYVYRNENHVKTKPRTVVLDEFPGDSYDRRFGSEYVDHARWAASNFDADIEDHHDLITASERLWDDDLVRAWLLGDAHNHDDIRPVETALRHAHTIIDDVLAPLASLEENHPGFVETIDLDDTIATVRDAHPEWTVEGTQDAIDAISSGAERAESHLKSNPSTTSLNAVPDLLQDAYFALTEYHRALTGNIDTTDGDDAVAINALGTVDVPDTVHGDLATLVEDSLDAFSGTDADTAAALLTDARTALDGGDDGTAVLATHASDGFAHPLAHELLHALIANPNDDDVAVVNAPFDINPVTGKIEPASDERSRLTRSKRRRTTALADRNQNGAVLRMPPEFKSHSGKRTPIIGLDATGRPELWELAIGRTVETADVHDTPRDRRAFLNDVLNLQVVQTATSINAYSGGGPQNIDADVELLRRIAGEYGNHTYTSIRRRHLTNRNSTERTTRPGVITTKKMEDRLMTEVSDEVGEFAHYGDVTGSNALGHHNVGVVLGSRHYGDHIVGYWSALAGEDAKRTGFGEHLDYGSDIGNTFLKHMREDQTLQAILRFARSEEGAVVFAHTGALRDDLPVVANGQVVRTFQSGQKAIANAARQLRGEEFTAGDVRDLLDEDGHDVTARHVRRVLAEFSEFGYLSRSETGVGRANTYDVDEVPPNAEIDLPSLDVDASDPSNPGGNPQNVVYTWNVRVAEREEIKKAMVATGRPTIPAPEAKAGGTGPT